MVIRFVKRKCNFNARCSVSCFYHSFFLYLLRISFCAYFSRYLVLVSLSHSYVCITVSSSLSRSFILPCLFFLFRLSVSVLSVSCFVLLWRDPRYRLFAPCLCPTTFFVPIFSFSSEHGTLSHHKWQNIFRKPNNGMRHQGVAHENTVWSGVEKWFICCKALMDKWFNVRNGQRKVFWLFVNELLRRYWLTLICHTPTCKNNIELQVRKIFA